MNDPKRPGARAHDSLELEPGQTWTRRYQIGDWLEIEVDMQQPVKPEPKKGGWRR